MQDAENAVDYEAMYHSLLNQMGERTLLDADALTRLSVEKDRLTRENTTLKDRLRQVLTQKSETPEAPDERDWPSDRDLHGEEGPAEGYPQEG